MRYLGNGFHYDVANCTIINSDNEQVGTARTIEEARRWVNRNERQPETLKFSHSVSETLSNLPDFSHGTR